jgi:ferredoxin-NADP reductase
VVIRGSSSATKVTDGVTTPPVGGWQLATVTAIRQETALVKTLSLRLTAPTPHRAGQYFVVRLVAPDGYTAQRSYSVASPPGDGWSIDLTIERLPDGEVSTFLHDELVVGDQLEVRGPIGGWFTWDGATPALLIGGGAGVVPLMSMLRFGRRLSAPDVHLIVSTRTPSELIYADEITGGDVTVVYSRAAPPGHARPAGRLTADDVRPHLRDGATVFICGSAGFAAAATERAVEAGAPTESIRVERFGPTG